MVTNPMQRKAKNSFLLGVLITVLIMGAIVAFLMFQLYKMYMAEKERTDSMVSVCVLSQDVKSGDEISGKFTMKSVDSAIAPANSLYTTSEKNNVAKIDLKAGTVLTESLIQESDEVDAGTARVQEYNMIKLSSQITSGDFIDVRLRLPSGLDYIVVSKKKVEVPLIAGVESEDSIWIKMTEDETLVMSNAIVETYIMEGATLYTTKYIDPGLTGASIPTYVPSANIQYLIHDNPNILAEAKNALITRFNANTSNRDRIVEDVKKVEDDKKTEYIKTNVKNEIDNAKKQREKYLSGLAAE